MNSDTESKDDADYDAAISQVSDKVTCLYANKWHFPMSCAIGIFP